MDHHVVTLLAEVKLIDSLHLLLIYLHRKKDIRSQIPICDSYQRLLAVRIFRLK